MIDRDRGPGEGEVMSDEYRVFIGSQIHSAHYGDCARDDAQRIASDLNKSLPSGLSAVVTDWRGSLVWTHNWQLDHNP